MRRSCAVGPHAKALRYDLAGGGVWSTKKACEREVEIARELGGVRGVRKNEPGNESTLAEAGSEREILVLDGDVRDGERTSSVTELAARVALERPSGGHEGFGETTTSFPLSGLAGLRSPSAGARRRGAKSERPSTANARLGRGRESREDVRSWSPAEVAMPPENRGVENVAGDVDGRSGPFLGVMGSSVDARDRRGRRPGTSRCDR